MPKTKSNDDTSLLQELRDLLTRIMSVPLKKGAKLGEELELEEAEEVPASSEEKSEEIDFPDAEALTKLRGGKLVKLAEQISLSTDGLKESRLKELLSAVSNILTNEEDEVDEEDATELCERLSVEQSKKYSKNIKALREYFNVGAEEAEETEETDSVDGIGVEEEAVAEPKSQKGKRKATAAEEVEEVEEVDSDAAEIAAKAELPDLSIMKEQLAAYNEAASEDDQIEVEPGKTKAAYRQLLERMVDSEGNIAEWGEPYVSDGEVRCCGIGLDEHTVKGEKDSFGKCVVTDKVFKVDADDGTATEYKAKKK